MKATIRKGETYTISGDERKVHNINERIVAVGPNGHNKHRHNTQQQTPTMFATITAIRGY